MGHEYFSIFSTLLGHSAIVWHIVPRGVKIKRILLPQSKTRLIRTIKQLFPDSQKKEHRHIQSVICTIRTLLRGKPASIPLDILDFSALTAFERLVLKNTRTVMCGSVRSYGEIAKRIGKPKAYRAVGNALAKNPFPLVIPCHRVIAANNNIGGFQEGSALKKNLLIREGISFKEHRYLINTGC